MFLRTSIGNFSCVSIIIKPRNENALLHQIFSNIKKVPLDADSCITHSGTKESIVSVLFMKIVNDTEIS